MYGDVRDVGSLRPLFEDAGADRIAVIHTAGIVGIADTPDPVMHDVNVNGTSTVAALCAEYGARMVYVSSVHAIPGKRRAARCDETDAFSPESGAGLVRQKCKAEATRNVLAAVRERGLDAVVVHPSGIIGPYTEDNHLVQLIGEYIDGSLPACVRGGYDFVDVRDVAAGCIAAADRGRRGECYILSNRHYEVRELLELARRCGGRAAAAVLPAMDGQSRRALHTAVCARRASPSAVHRLFHRYAAEQRPLFARQGHGGAGLFPARHRPHRGGHRPLAAPPSREGVTPSAPPQPRGENAAGFAMALWTSAA